MDVYARAVSRKFPPNFKNLTSINNFNSLDVTRNRTLRIICFSEVGLPKFLRGGVPHSELRFGKGKHSMKSKETRLRAWYPHALKKVILSCIVSGILSTAGSSAIAQTRVAYVVQNDRGGMIGERRMKVDSLRSTGQRVELRGTCLSACTMYLSLPNTCVYSNASLGFHGPTTRDGQRLSNSDFDYWSSVMASNYREPLRQWFMTKARYLTSGYYKLTGAELIRMGYQQC